MAGALTIAVLALASSTVVASTRDDPLNGTCLLHRRASLSKTHALVTEQGLITSWRSEQLALVQEMEAKKGVIDGFIAAQEKSGNACSARLLEAKQALDALSDEVSSLTNMVNSHEKVLEAETSILRSTLLAQDNVEEQYEEAMERCDKLKEQALADARQYSKELKELKQIAGVSNKEFSAKDLRSLLETSWTKQRCVSFVDFMNRREGSATFKARMGKQAPAGKADPDCEKQKEELQKEFTKAYIGVKDLLEDAKKRFKDKTCNKTATSEREAKMAPLIAQEASSTEKIEESSHALEALKPALELAMDRAKAMKKHINKTLKPECLEGEDVSDYLRKVQDLILKLTKCPGQGAYKLKIPGKDESLKIASTKAPPIVASAPPPGKAAFPAVGSPDYTKMKAACQEMVEEDEDLKMVFEDHGGSVEQTIAFCKGEGEHNADFEVDFPEEDSPEFAMLKAACKEQAGDDLEELHMLVEEAGSTKAAIAMCKEGGEGAEFIEETDPANVPAAGASPKASSATGPATGAPML